MYKRVVGVCIKVCIILEFALLGLYNLLGVSKIGIYSNQNFFSVCLSCPFLKLKLAICVLSCVNFGKVTPPTTNMHSTIFVGSCQEGNIVFLASDLKSGKPLRHLVITY